MATSHNGNDYERLKEELRRMKRRGAPWYFESALHQRLHGGVRRRPRLRPISIVPVLAVAVLTLCILGVAVYVVLLHTNLLLPGPPPGGPAPGADTLFRRSTADSVLSVPAGSSAHPRVPVPPQAPASAPERALADTQKTPPAENPSAKRDSDAVRRDSADSRRDSSSHGADTTAPPGTGTRNGEIP